MSRWKVIIPALIVLAVALFVYMRTAPGLQNNELSDEGAVKEQTQNIGESTGDSDVDALIDEIIEAADAEAEATSAVSEEGDIVTAAEDDNQLLIGEYYEE